MNIAASGSMPGGTKATAEQRARTSEERFRHVIDNMQEFVFSCDGKGTILMVNPSMVTLLGYSDPQEMLGNHVAELVCNSHDEHERIQRKLATSDTLSCERLVFRRKDGSRLVVEANICAVRGPNGAVVRIECVGRDTTQRQRVEDDLRRAKEAAEAATRAKSEFLANISHELRTPLNAIVGLAHLFERTPLGQRQRELLSKLQASADGLLALIGDLLDFSKIEAGKVELEETEFEIEPVLERVANALRSKAQNKGLEIKVRIAPAVPRAVMGDAMRLGQVLLNLVGNAVKFTEQGGVSMAVEVAARAGAVAHLRFSIRDTGQGIPTEQQHRLFEPFVQADSSITRRHGGTGLGLAISKQLVGLMGGALSLDSAPGQGTTFSFTVKVGVPANAAEEEVPPDASKLRVLAVDDSYTGREVLRAHLQAMELPVYAVATGAEALRELQAASTPYDLVLLDWYMQDMDGPEVAQRINSGAGLKKIPRIVMVTGKDDETPAEALGALGVDGLITKPVDEAALRSKIESFFGPMSTPQQAASEVADPAPAAPAPAMVGRRVLVVEDNEINQEVAKGILEEAGIAVEVAGNGREALNVLRHDTGFDAILMDLQMPVMDGLTATRAIRDDAATVGLPVIALTADAVVAQRDRCLEVGMDEFLTKPISPKRLLETLERVFSNRPSPPTGTIRGAAPNPVAVQARPPTPRPGEPLPGLDTRAALRRLMGNRALYDRLLHAFAGEHAEDVARIRDALERGDTAAAKATAHELKGVAGNLSATQVFTIAARVETLLCESELAPLGAQLDELAASLKEVSQSIATIPTSHHEARAAQ